MQTAKERTRFVTEGEVYTLKVGPTHMQSTREFTVGPQCDEDNGRWICMTCDKVFANPMEKTQHCLRGQHVIAWYCMHHGPEVP